ncbi:hypothetical protein BH23CHL7_BH23CHL7_23640 [soil metagenome]
MTTCYLDPDDEITGAVARIRAVEDGEVIIVLPPGSRIATSRINFRLLAREAEQKGLTIVAVSDEPGVRALAISAGLPAYDTVAAAQSGLAEFARQDRRLSERLGSAPPSATDPRPTTRPADSRPAARPLTEAGYRPPRASTDLPLEATRVLPAPAAPEQPSRPRTSVPAGGDDDYDAPRARPRAQRRRWALSPLIAVALLVALVGVALYGAYNLIPTATVIIRPHLTAVGPIRATVVADPHVAVIDAGAGLVPAQRLQLPLSVSDEFEATGTRVATARATGTVEFRSENTVDEVPIPANTRVATAAGVAFETTEAVQVPVADFGSGTAGMANAAVRAVRAGPRGNVAAETISVLPEDLAARRIFVNNPQPTTGGERRETRVVAATDYEDAVATLREQLDDRLAVALADPANTPRGLTIFAASATIGEAVPDPPQPDIVDVAAETFSLTVNATATVLAVNEAQVDEVALEQLRALVPPNATIVNESVAISHTAGAVSGDAITFSASANGSAYRMPDRDQLVEEIRGLPLVEAQAIIERYGNAEVSVWPDFIDRVPDQPARINLTILPPTETT